MLILMARYIGREAVVPKVPVPVVVDVFVVSILPDSLLVGVSAGVVGRLPVGVPGGIPVVRSF